MAFNLRPAPRSQRKCERYTTSPFIINEVNATDATLQDILELAFDNDVGGGEYPTFGPVAVTDIILEVSVVPEDEDDVILVNGQESAGFTFTADTEDATTFPGTTPISIPVGCEGSVSVCFRKCLNKAEQATL